MALLVSPKDPHPTYGIGPNRFGRHFARRTQTVDKLGVSREEDIVRSAIIDLLGKQSGRPVYETNPNARSWVRFFKLLGEKRFEVGQVRSGGHGECGLSHRKRAKNEHSGGEGT